MILPWPQLVDGGKVGVGDIAGLARPADSGDINPDMISTNICDGGTPDAVLHHTEDAENAVEAPNGHRSVEPVVVEVVAPLEDDMVPVKSCSAMIHMGVLTPEKELVVFTSNLQGQRQP